ncbi:MAG TPA: GGDEF domain-containing protein [Thermoanaerobaculia bacterium]|jgi:diguanylate cyclase (GGDEF)-like protein
MELSVLGCLVQTVGAVLLGVIFLYLSRGGADRVLHAAGWGWLCLFLALTSFLFWSEFKIPFGGAVYLFFKLLFIGSLILAAARMSRDRAAGRGSLIAAFIALLISLGAELLAPSKSAFLAIHTALMGVGWAVVTVNVLRSRTRGLGRPLAGTLAAISVLLHAGYAWAFAVSAMNQDVAIPLLAYTGFYDLFLEMLFGIGLIIWAMEDSDARLATHHARARDVTQRSRKRVQFDPLTEAHNRFFLDELRPMLSSSPAGGSIVLIDVDGLKTINDTEGHEEGDRAIWTVAAAIKKLIRGDDYLIRWGGDEFLVILSGMDEDLAKKRFYMLPAKIDEVRQSPNPKAYRKFIAASVGVTPFSTRVPFDIAIEMADRVMYERKKAQKEMRGVEMRRGAATPARDVTGAIRRIGSSDKVN